jgi:hypothetical protein
MAWEYKIVYFCTEPLKDEGATNRGVRMLNELGGQGREPVQFLGHPLTEELWKHHAVFKRACSE